MVHDRRICKWCGKEIEGKGWKDGPNIYCDFECFSAKNCWLILGLIIFFTPLILLLATPDMQDWILDRWSGLGPFLSLLAYYIFLTFSFLMLLSFYYSMYMGWRVRNQEKDLSDSIYPSEKLETYDSQ
jgi:hypothetical protein